MSVDPVRQGGGSDRVGHGGYKREALQGNVNRTG